MKYKAVYVGNEDKRIKGSFHGLTKAYRMQNGFIFEFNKEKNAIRASKIFNNSGYETVRLM